MGAADMKINIIWKISKAQYSSGEDAFLGSIKVGSIHWNGIDRDPNLRYVATCLLPGIKPQLGKLPTEQLAKNAVEMAINAWIEKSEINK